MSIYTYLYTLIILALVQITRVSASPFPGGAGNAGAQGQSGSGTGTAPAVETTPPNSGKVATLATLDAKVGQILTAMQARTNKVATLETVDAKVSQILLAMQANNANPPPASPPAANSPPPVQPPPAPNTPVSDPPANPPTQTQAPKPAAGVKNLNLYKGTVGGAQPAQLISEGNGIFRIIGTDGKTQTRNQRREAINTACNFQKNDCSAKINAGGNANGPVDVSVCETQAATCRDATPVDSLV